MAEDYSGDTQGLDHDSSGEPHKVGHLKDLIPPEFLTFVMKRSA